MSIEQVSLEIMGRTFNIGTPSEEKATLLQAVNMLNQKFDTIKQSGRIVETDKIIIMASLNLVHDLLKMTVKDDLAIGEFERKITDMINTCEKVLSKSA
ncbi:MULTISPECIES: cell division protein ZapA [unclassified Neisseria]|uniref:cell division protein ZapA n=1 Tax=unclassified Neisseria TaxID=2623750 RepID=UPI002665406A|nr:MULTISPECIES: cell division protein ZapA [unclassified Neisseria]MDO1510022.1 cell division protein ZapA [Neisseria sp. MVDL19-042950]MDO1516222.1 cell division protein ZapA [Neisseria sp. MVDL18-041461]MDO1563337.1 cell division protein ZapA [Neisseria sp. MVDL20-010259]